MSVQCPSHNAARDLSSVIAFLIDVQEALEENDLHEEAQLVSSHLHELSSPDIESVIEKNGIDPVLEEMAASFS